MAEFKLVTIETKEDYKIFDYLYTSSAYTITGVGGNIIDWIEGITNVLQKNKIGKPESFFTFTGAQMNEAYGLQGDVAYPDDLHFLAFPLDGLDIGKLSLFKLAQHDRWFDDIVDNNAEHLSTIISAHSVLH